MEQVFEKLETEKFIWQPQVIHTWFIQLSTETLETYFNIRMVQNRDITPKIGRLSSPIHKLPPIKTLLPSIPKI